MRVRDLSSSTEDDDEEEDEDEDEIFGLQIVSLTAYNYFHRKLCLATCTKYNELMMALTLLALVLFILIKGLASGPGKDLISFPFLLHHTSISQSGVSFLLCKVSTFI